MNTDTHCETCRCNAKSRRSKPKSKALPTRQELERKKMTPARAAALRRLNAELCGCTLCLWALYPSTTFADHEARMATCAEMNERGTWNDLHRDWKSLLSDNPLTVT